MRTEAHLREAEETNAHTEAMRIAIHIKELAATLGHDPKGVKVFSKKDIMNKGYGKATSMIQWQDGPDNWAEYLEPFLLTNASILTLNNTIVFYDV